MPRRAAWLPLLLVLTVAPSPAAAGRLERHAPVVVHDSRERHPLASVRAFAGRVPGVARGRVRPTVYGRRVGPWLQYWMVFARDGQTRSPLRTGRHDGDWETIALRLRRGRPVQAVYGQHAGAEACGWGGVRRARDRPVVWLARGSHAAFFVPGVRDRPWPLPNDEADGRGLRVRPRVVRITRTRPPWMRHRGRWGASRAGGMPGERSSPRGPAFQPAGRWSDLAAWAAGAVPCLRERCDERGECDGGETTLAAIAALLGLFGAILYGGRRLRAAERPGDPAAPHA